MGVEEGKDTERRTMLPGERNHEHVAKRNRKYLGYSTGSELARPAVRKADWGLPPSNYQSQMK